MSTGAGLEHGVLRPGVVESRDLLHDVAELAENRPAVQVDDPLAVALHEAPLANALPTHGRNAHQ